MAGTYISLPLGRSLYWDDAVANVGALPAAGTYTGEAVLVISVGAIYYWDGAAWQVTNSSIVALTPNRAVVTDGTGELIAATTTATEIGFVNGVTSAIQTQLNGKQATGNYITALTGDVTAAGPGSAAATVAAVGGQTAAAVAAGAVLANAATSANTASAIVRRDGSGNFVAGTITANLTGNASGSAASFTGSLVGDVTGTQGATVVSTVGAQTAANVAAATVLANAATSANTANAIVKRGAAGEFDAGAITTTTAKVGATGAVTASAILEVASTTGFFLLPRMTTAQRDAVATPASGSMLYNTTTSKVQVREGAAWLDITGWGS